MLLLPPASGRRVHWLWSGSVLAAWFGVASAPDEPGREGGEQGTTTPGTPRKDSESKTTGMIEYMIGHESSKRSEHEISEE